MNGPLYEETREHILAIIRAMLASGQDKLPTEKELATGVTASYGTVRLVMKELAEEGYVRKIPGSGTYLKAEAATRLEQEAWPTLRLFTPTYRGTADSDYGAWIVSALRSAAERNRWKIQHTFVRTNEEFITQMRKSVGPDEAVVYLPTTEPFEVRQLGELAHFDQQPIVIIDMELNNISICNITSDNRFGGMIAARQLLESGCRNLTILLCEPPTYNCNARLRGFSEAAGLYGVKPELLDCKVNHTDNREQLAYRHTLARLRSGSRPDGIFAISDSGALGALRAIRECGLTPGQDINLVGFDGLAVGTAGTPTLATVVQPVEEITAAIFDTLRNWHPGMHTQQLLSPSFRSGGSLGRITAAQKLEKVR